MMFVFGRRNGKTIHDSTILKIMELKKKGADMHDTHALMMAIGILWMAESANIITRDEYKKYFAMVDEELHYILR